MSEYDDMRFFPDNKPSVGLLSVQDVGLLLKQAQDKSNPRLQEAAIRLLSLFPRPKFESDSKNKI